MPYYENEVIDFDVLSREVDFVLDAGAEGIVLALASELTRLTDSERLELTEKLPQMVHGRGTVTISVGAETIYQAVHFLSIIYEL